jgi:SAM-dependent methyltransferase
MSNPSNVVDCYKYVGSELTLFKHVHNWKKYFASQLAPFIRGDVLEVGAGNGGSTHAVFTPRCASWTCLEPDRGLARELTDAVASLRDREGRAPRVHIGFVADLAPGQTYDSILYIDTLEHVEHDAEELAAAARHLRPGGTIAVMSPAHQWLYTPFDRAIGHFRRYSLESLRSVGPRELEVVHARYLDAAGVFASLANRVFMRASMPTARQLAVWDNVLVPASRLLDPLLAYRVGKSVICVWRAAG